VLELHERGQSIEVLSEGEFLQMIGGTGSGGVHLGQQSFPAALLHS
jgi:DNA polymerase-3 subunit epsilon